MFFFLKLAWGNLVKNRQNTSTILTVVVICVFFMEFGMGYMDGFKQKMVNDALMQTGNIKVYNEDYYKSLDFFPVNHNMPYDAAKIKAIEMMPGVTSVRAEINFGALANSVTDNHDSMVRAIDPANSSGIYDKLKKSVKEGRFIEGKNELVIGYKAARFLKAALRDRIIILTVDTYGGINAAEGKIVGLINTKNPDDDENLIVCTLDFARRALALGNGITELIVNIKDPMHDEKAAADISGIYGAGYSVVPWQEGQAYILDLLKLLNISTLLIAIIIMSVAALGIVNSFLMNIMGRLPEFGIFRATGVSGRQLFMMIIAESSILGVIGTAMGMIPGLIVNYYFMVNPIDYSSMADVLKGIGGLDVMIGTAILPQSTAVVVVTGIFISILASFYPAWLAVSKKPVELMRSI